MAPCRDMEESLSRWDEPGRGPELCLPPPPSPPFSFSAPFFSRGAENPLSISHALPSSRRRQWHPLQSSRLENLVDGGAWWAAVHGVAKSQTRLSDFTSTFHFHALEKEMATHSRVLAWRIPGTGEPGGLPSMGSHRVRHDCSDLAAAAAFIQPLSFLSLSPCLTRNCSSLLVYLPNALMLPVNGGGVRFCFCN